MVHIYPFAAVKPADGKAQQIAAVPYDVVSAKEAREIITDQPLSFLRISRADALLPDTDPYADQVYSLSRTIFDEYLRDEIFVQESKPALYVYRVLHEGRSYTGLSCCVDCREYKSGVIHRHELTRYDKEEDRTRHIDTMNANTGPVVLLHLKNQEVATLLAEAAVGTPLMQVTAANGSIHQIYAIRDSQKIQKIVGTFASIPALYIADGHHRCKSALNVAERRIGTGISIPEETWHVMGVVFAEDEVKVHGYSRLLTTLGEYSPQSFLTALRAVATVSPFDAVDPAAYSITPKEHTPGLHIFHLYLEGKWYECAIQITGAVSRIDSLDVSVLQDQVLVPFLGITDSRGDARLQYLGGARPIRDLMAKVDSGEFVAAIAMQPVDVTTVCSIADEGGIMPPKSTWFEPKLLSGLLVHQLE
ncbi:MAG: DUF1015 family protein [Methanospirillum sp.]|uniref:DUF1015 domain-containing protein n=1 Tax=Methanospirillum sp. TaxID=45200 RepID=UPI00236D1401|nr:DUF1015 family protein [Methanospirillum sp.]MDD1730115.1 DUF1015 family protein [Methanospirillum sp.]